MALIERLRTSAHNMEVIGERMPINAVERAAIKCLRGAIDDAAAALSAIPVPSPMGEERVTQADRERAILLGKAEGWDWGEDAVRAGDWDHDDVLIHLAEHRIRAIQAAVAEADEWRRVVTDALVVSYIYRKEHDSDPRLALNELLCWERVIALDPKVSEGAAKLVAETIERCAQLAEQFPSRLDDLSQAEAARGIATAIRKGVA